MISGDSAAAGVGAPSQETALSGQLVAALARDHAVTWSLEAATGATTRDTVARLSALPPRPFDVAVLSLGVNDTTRLRRAAIFSTEQSALAELLATRFGVRAIIATALPPMHLYPLLPQPLRWVVGAHAARLDARLAALAATRPGFAHLRLDLSPDPVLMAADGYHPSPALHALWAQAAARAIRDRLT